MARLRQYKIVYICNYVWNRNKKNLAAKRFATKNFLARSNMLENVHEPKLLQPITAFDEG